MKSRLVLIALLWLFCFEGYGQTIIGGTRSGQNRIAGSSENKENDLSNNNIKGKVKSLTLYHYRSRELFEKIYYSHFQTKEFNINGNITRIIMGSPDPDREQTYYDEFDDEGYEVVAIRYWVDGSVKNKNTYDNKYDNKGNRTSCIVFSNGSIAAKKTYEYDEAGKLVEHIHYNSDESIFGKHIYEYDKLGKLVEWIHYNSDEKKVRQERYEHDQKGNKVVQHDFFPMLSSSSKITYEYNDEGNQMVKTIISYTFHIITDKTTYVYDKEGNNLEIKEYGTKKRGFGITENIENKHTYEYDKRGNLVEWIHHNSEGSNSESYEYEYDSQGNWIRRIVFDDGSVSAIGERKIEYYD